MTKSTLLCVLVIGLIVVANSIKTESTVLAAEEKKCDADKFMCRSGRCIPNAWKCDGDADCEDGDDESTCPATDDPDKCNKDTEYQCEVRDDKSSRPSARTLFHSLPAHSLFTNICIPSQWVCDGETDCMHGDDENNCKDNKVNCTDAQFHCQSFEGHSSTCIPISWKCDGTSDCAGGFDELNCTDTANRQCDPSIEFKCGNGKCIYNGWKCDGDDDCSDGKPGEPSSDEKDCSDKKVCDEATHFKCKKVSFCILKSWQCDGEADCPDQSDEEDCKSFNPLHNVTCKANEFKCTSGAHCVNKEFVCDGDNDCPDKSDEFNCKTIDCRQGFKACSPGICRLESDFCNGIKDCPNGEDELGCPTHTTNFTHFCNSDTEYTCPNETPLRCIPYADLCLSKTAPNDCSISSVCNRNLLLGTCNYTDPYCKCRDMYTRNGTVCTCPDGFETRNGLCLDINECNTPGACDQRCENLPGTFRCHCHRGYRLTREEHALKATKCRAVGSDPLLLLSNRAAIRQYDMMTNRYQPLVNRLESAVAMDYWHKNETLIWSDVSKEKIMMCRMKQDGLLKNQTNCIDDEANTTLVSNDVLTPDGLAVDWVHGLLFWTDTGLDKIYVLDLITRHRRVLIDSGLDEPRAIAVDPTAGLIFWSDWGARARIERAGMDGKNRLEILSGNSIRWPNGLAVDILDKRVYWADAKVKTISSSDYYGRDVRTVLHSNEYLRHPFSLTVFEERLYWSDWDKEGVLTVNKFRGDDVKVMISGVSGPMTVRVYHEMAQPNDTNKCDQNTCSHLCLPRAHIRANSSEAESVEKGFKPYICACATGYFVDTSDATACIVEKAIAEFADGVSSSTIAMFVFLVGAMVCAIGLAGYVWHGRRARPFSALQFENPVYRRTTEDPDAFESNGDNSLGAFPSDVTNPPLLPSRLVLNQPQTSSVPLTTNSSDFYHPDNYSYDQKIVRDETQNGPSA